MPQLLVLLVGEWVREWIFTLLKHLCVLCHLCQAHCQAHECIRMYVYVFVCVLQTHRYTQKDIERQRDTERENPLLCWTFYQWDSFCMDGLSKLFWKNSDLLWGGPQLDFRDSLHPCSRQHMTAKHRSLFLLGEGDGKGWLCFFPFCSLLCCCDSGPHALLH